VNTSGFGKRLRYQPIREIVVELVWIDRRRRWEFERDGRDFSIDPPGKIVVSNTHFYIRSLWRQWGGLAVDIYIFAY
jgi:hypothetical protein